MRDMRDRTQTCTVGVFHFQNHCIAKLTDLGITLDVFSSPKSVRNYSSHQNRWGETCYIVVTNKMFFSVIKSVLKSSLNSVQSYRNKKIRVKNVTEFSEKKCDSPRRATKRALNSVTKKEIHRIQ